jgi:hypothetical protein
MAMRYTIVQKELTAPTVEQLRRAFRALPRFADADAIRVAHDACGLLVKDLSSDEAPVLQRALRAEGLTTTLVGDGGLPRLPEAKCVRRLEVQPESLLVFDPIGRVLTTPWARIRLIAAGTVRHFGVSTTRTEERVTRFSPIRGLHVKTVEDVRHRVESDVRHLVDLFLEDPTARFQVEAEDFLFRFTPGQPDLDVAQKFGHLVHSLIRHAPQAALNRGAAGFRDDDAAPPFLYSSKSAFFDESTWWLWRLAHRGLPPEATNPGAA